MWAELSATAMSFVPLPRLVFPTAPPPRRDERAVYEALRKVEPSSLAQVLGEGSEHPPLEPPMTGLAGRVGFW